MGRKRRETPLKRINPSGKTAWVARWTDCKGKRRYGWPPDISGTYELKRDAQVAIDACYERDGQFGGNRDIETVGQYFAVWLQRHPRSQRTNMTYIGRVESVLAADLDGQLLKDLSLRAVRRRHGALLIDVMLRQHGRAASGARGVLSVLATMFEDAMNDDYVDSNPFLGLRVRKADPRVQKAPRTVTVATWPEMHAFAAAAGEQEVMVRVLSDCGLRLGELLALHCKHVQGDTLVVEQTAWRGLITPGTKQSARREVPIPPTLQAMLAAVSRDRIGLLFSNPNADGDVWSERSFYRAVWRPAQVATGMDLHPHAMRHSYVSLMRAAGVDPADLAAWTGHTVAVATGTYTHSMGATTDLARSVVG